VELENESYKVIELKNELRMCKLYINKFEKEIQQIQMKKNSDDQ
jgi:hypothetical protein